MMIIKRILALLFVTLLVVTLATCSDYGSNASNDNPNTNAGNNSNTRYQPE